MTVPSYTGGSEIDKIAEKLKSLVKASADEKLDKELLTCTESFDMESVDGAERDDNKENGETVFPLALLS